jgi:hypothetical protein
MTCASMSSADETRVAVPREVLGDGVLDVVAGHDGVGSVESRPSEFFFDLGASLREVLDHPARDAGDVGDMVVDGVSLNTKTPRQLAAKHTLI